MKTFTKLLLIMALGLIGSACQAGAPKGKLIYCSYAENRAGGLGRSYCDLIADPGQEPRVVVVLNQENHIDPDGGIRAEFPATAEDVERLQQELKDLKVYRLNGYDYEEPITGGASHRIYMEYDSGDKVNARWYGNKIKDSAITAYNHISHFFQPWVQQAGGQ